MWAATTKALKSLVSQGKNVDLPLLGKFKLLHPSTEDASVMFMPHLDFLASASFSFPENDCNVSPLGRRGIANLVTVSLSSVAAVCKMDRETCG